MTDAPPSPALPETDIAIVGGGLTGTALALALGQAGLSVTLLDAGDRAPKEMPGFDGRSYAIAQGSKRMLARLGLWDRLEPNAQPMQEIKVTDGAVGMAHVFLGLHFHAAELEEGPMGYMIEDRHLRRALLSALDDAPGVTARFGAHVTAQEIDARAARLTLDTGETVSARLVVGADGRQSGTGARAGIRRTEWTYPQNALVCAISHERDHGGIAHQLFLPSGPLAILPLRENRSAIVWTEARGLAQDLTRLDDADYLTVLRARIGTFLGALDLAGDRFTYPLSLSMADRLVADRLALVGDAARGIHPIAGQGLNSGLRDVAALAHVLTEARRRGEDIAGPLVLERYATWRRFDGTALSFATDAFNRLFSTGNPLLRGLRDLGMAGVNAIPDLRRAFMREAAGLTGDLPDLMR